VRVYVPATTSVLRRLVETGGCGPAPLTAFAVTPGLRESYLDDDVEALEYAAMLEAARDSLRLLAADRAAAPRRVVIAAELPDGGVAVRDDLGVGVVRVADAVSLRQVASVHVDDEDAEPAVRAATAVVAAADLDDPDASDMIDDTEAFELAWYASQEIAALLGSLAASGEPSTG
jgi:hypothetical protein